MLSSYERSIVIRAAESGYLHLMKMDCAGGWAVLDHGGEAVIGDENVFDYDKNTQSVAAFMRLIGRGIFDDYRHDGETYILSKRGRELALQIKDDSGKTA